MKQSVAQETGVVAPSKEDIKSDDWQQIRRLRWFLTLVPATGVFLFETLRHQLFEHNLPTTQGNIAAGLLALALAYSFSEVVLRTVDRLHRRSIEDQREIAALAAVVRERERLSRELHDGLAQVVSFLLLRLDTVEELIRAGRLDDGEAELNKLRALADDLYADVRESISGLRSRVVELGLRQALEDYIEEFEERHGVDAVMSCPLTLDVSPTIELQLFRIAQEALSNVRKHSGARHVEVSIRLAPSQSIELEVSDDGSGFDVDRASNGTSSSFGLIGIKERAEALGGTCRIESAIGQGTRITVTAPLHSTTDETSSAAAR